MVLTRFDTVIGLECHRMRLARSQDMHCSATQPDSRVAGPTAPLLYVHTDGVVTPGCMPDPGLKGWRPDSIIMDVPRLYHNDKFLVFLGVEGLLVAVGVLSYSAQGRPT